MNPEFKKIDDKLKQFAQGQKAKIFKSGSGMSVGDMRVPPDKIKERRIEWIDGSIGKIISILPNFRLHDIHSPSWDFMVLAWLEDDTYVGKEVPIWSRFLLKSVSFNEIENNIDLLLKQSIEYLNRIKIEDLRIGG